MFLGFKKFTFSKSYSGSIDLKEMTKIMGCLLELEGIGKVDLIDLSSVKRFSCDS